MGVALDELTTLLASQGPAWVTSAEELVNEAVRRNYTAARLRSKKDIMEMVQGGDQIQDRVFFEESGTYERIGPNHTYSYLQPQTGTNWTVPWAFASVYTTWTEQDVGLNANQMSGRFRTQMYKRVLRQKKQDMWTSACNGRDDEWWAAPDFTNMEASQTPTDPRKPYSFPCGLNEFSNGLPVGLGETSWTTFQGIDPSAQSKWRCYQTTYGATDGTALDMGTSTAATGNVVLFPALSRAIHKCKLARLPKNPEYSDKTTSPHVIWTQLDGLTNYEAALRMNQDFFRGVGLQTGQDPDYDGPTFRGIPIEDLEALDTAAIYPTGTNSGTQSAVAWSTYDDTTNATAGTATNRDAETFRWGEAGPRYYVANLEYYLWAVHSAHYWDTIGPFMPTEQPHSRVLIAQIWDNLCTRSLMRQATVTPGGPVTNA